MTLTLSEDDTSVCNDYPLLSTYLINSPNVKASAENVHLWYKHKFTDICAIHWCELFQWLSAAADVTRQSSTSSAFWYPLLTLPDCFPDFIITGFRPELLRRLYILKDEFWGLTRNMPLKSAAIAICKFHKVV